MSLAALDTPAADFGAMLVTLAANEGSAAHPYTHSAELNAGPTATRNLADALHLLSMLHGEQPGLIDIAAERNPMGEADLWFARTARGFATERAYLAQLIVVAGPTPSTPGEAETAATLVGQRQALGMMGRSERFGCAIGATAGLLLDWQAIRAVLDTAAERLGVAITPCVLPDEASTAALLGLLPEHPRLDRTLSFGARQLLAQHHHLWELLEARTAARAAVSL